MTATGTPQESLTASINSKLNQAKTRLSGLNLLAESLDQISPECLHQYANLWLSKALQELENINNDTCSINQICRATGLLVAALRNFAELRKLVALQYVKQLLNIIINFEPHRRSGGTFYLLAMLLHNYPENCARSQESLTKVILSVVDSENEVMVSNGARCYALLSKAIEKSFKPAASQPNYTGYMYNEYLLCNTLHSILDEIFTEKTDDESSNSETLDLPSIGHDDVLEYFDAVERRIKNLCVYLSTMLRTKINTASVSTRDILELLCKSFELTMQAKNSHSVRQEHLQTILFRIYISFAAVLQAFIIGFGPDLLPNAIPILQLITQTFSWTEKISEKELVPNISKLVTNVRIEAYKSLSTWLRYCGSASAIEWVADKLLNLILRDVIPKKVHVTLGTQNSLFMTKKAYRKFKNSVNLEQKVSPETPSFKADPSSRAEVNSEALIALQKIISKGNQFLKPSFYERIEGELIPFTYYLYTTVFNSPQLYRVNEKCRLELLLTLKSLVVNPHPNKPAPIANIIEIFRLARNDHSCRISEEADLVLSILEKICHPVAPSLFLSVPLSSKRHSVSGPEELNEMPQKQQKTIPLLDVSETVDLISNKIDLINENKDIEEEIRTENQNQKPTEGSNSSTNSTEASFVSCDINGSMEVDEPDSILENSKNLDFDETITENSQVVDEICISDEENKITSSQETPEGHYLTLKEIQNLSEESEGSQEKNEKELMSESVSEKNIEEIDEILQLFHNEPTST